jgi:hypothetical protein
LIIEVIQFFKLVDNLGQSPKNRKLSITRTKQVEPLRRNYTPIIAVAEQAASALFAGFVSGWDA